MRCADSRPFHKMHLVPLSHESVSPASPPQLFPEYPSKVASVAETTIGRKAAAHMMFIENLMVDTQICLRSEDSRITATFLFLRMVLGRCPFYRGLIPTCSYNQSPKRASRTSECNVGGHCGGYANSVAPCEATWGGEVQK